MGNVNEGMYIYRRWCQSLSLMLCLTVSFSCGIVYSSGNRRPESEKNQTSVYLIKRKTKKKNLVYVQKEAAPPTAAAAAAAVEKQKEEKMLKARSNMYVYSSTRIFGLIFENEKTVQPESTRATRKTYLTHPYIIPVSYTHLTLPTKA